MTAITRKKFRPPWLLLAYDLFLPRQFIIDIKLNSFRLRLNDKTFQDQTNIHFHLLANLMRTKIKSCGLSGSCKFAQYNDDSMIVCSSQSQKCKLLKKTKLIWNDMELIESELFLQSTKSIAFFKNNKF